MYIEKLPKGCKNSKMAILETGLVLDGSVLVNKKYYRTEHELDDDLKGGLLTAVSGFANEAFDSEFDSFTLQSYKIVAVTDHIELPSGFAKDGRKSKTLIIFSIVDKDMNDKVVKGCMKQALNQFKARYSLNDMMRKKFKRFKKFEQRFDNIFQDLTLRPEDQFAAIF